MTSSPEPPPAELTTCPTTCSKEYPTFMYIDHDVSGTGLNINVKRVKACMPECFAEYGVNIEKPSVDERECVPKALCNYIERTEIYYSEVGITSVPSTETFETRICVHDCPAPKWKDDVSKMCISCTKD